jgi:TRAP-type C4-dicarboxylate transport system permease small subunit
VLVKLARLLAHRMSQVAGLMILAIAIIVFIDVVLRQVFSAPIGGIAEVAGYGLAIVITWGLSDAFLHRRHIRIDVIYFLMPASVRVALDLITLLVMLVVMIYLGRLTVNMTLLAIEFKSLSSQPLFLPLAPIQGLWAAGIVVFIVVLAVVAVSAARELVRGNLEGVQQLLAPPSTSEAIDEELKSLIEHEDGES